MGHDEKRRVRVDAKKFAAIYNFVSTEETRYYLNGVYIEPLADGGVLMVGTNGHVLGACVDRTGEADGPWICPVQKRMLATARRRPKRSPLENPGNIHFVGSAAYLLCNGWEGDDPTAITDATLEVAHAPAIDGTFPDFRRVVPDPVGDELTIKLRKNASETPLAFAANCEYITLFSDAVRKIAGMEPREHPPLSFFPSDEIIPILIKSDRAPDFIGVLMPMRGTDDGTLPDWIKRQESAE